MSYLVHLRFNCLIFQPQCSGSAAPLLGLSIVPQIKVRNILCL